MAALNTVSAQVPGERPVRDARVEVLNPRCRVPVSLIIDDSTCLVNLNHFAIPQIRAAWNDGSYTQDWKKMPREIPDDFVRKFGDWCGANGVKGKYSIVPYPACVGRLDGELPGWSPDQVRASIKLVRELMTPNWDIHPEMVTHTRVIDLRTGHPYPFRNLDYMENWKWTGGKTVDEIASYMAYALRILHNIDLPCEGITTPGAFGNNALPQLAQATLEACRDVYRAEVPHYFRHLISEGKDSVAPRVEYASGIAGQTRVARFRSSAAPGLDRQLGRGTDSAEPDRFITADLAKGRMVDVIGRGEPACMVCHWTGIHHNGTEAGFRAFQEVVRRLHARYDNLIWMKLGEISRYWAAKELTAISGAGPRTTFNAPFACPLFTLRLRGVISGPVSLWSDGREEKLREVSGPLKLESNTWTRDTQGVLVCLDLPRGHSVVSAS